MHKHTRNDFYKIACYILLFLIVLSATSYSQSLPPEDFESGIGDWSVSNGLWEVGQPSYGLYSGFQSLNCVGTVLSGDFPDQSTSSSLVSPWFIVPDSLKNPRLRFWHWFSTGSSSVYNYGEILVEVRNQPLESVSNRFFGSSAVWTKGFADLRAYANEEIRIHFRFTTSNYGSSSAGWYIDDVLIDTGSYQFNNPEDFESGIGDWSVSNGLWEVGQPSYVLDSGYQSPNCAGTVLAGDFPDQTTSSSLVSPWFIVPDSLKNPRLRFWHWFSTGSSSVYNYGEILVEVRNQPLESVSNRFFGSSAVWTKGFADLRAYANEEIRIHFRFTTSNYGSSSAGWYIDDVLIDTGSYQFNNPEDFESGIGDWSVSNGLWEVGQPSYVLDSGYQSPNCAGTVLAGDFPDQTTSSSLVSPWFIVPDSLKNPRLRFWHWFSTGSSSVYNYGEILVEVRNQPLESVSNRFFGSSAVWTKGFADLRAYANEEIRIHFRFTTSNYGSSSTGWYIDDVSIDSTHVTVGDYFSNSDTSFSVPVNLTTSQPVSGFTIPLRIEYDSIESGTVLIDSVIIDSVFTDSVQIIQDSINQIIILTRDPVLHVSDDPILPEDSTMKLAEIYFTTDLNASNIEFVIDTTSYTFNKSTTVSYIIKDSSGTDIDAGFEKGMVIIQNPLGIDDIDIGSLPNTIQLFQNYPNPFNMSTEIQFSLDSKTFIDITIFNLLGQKIKSVVSETLPVGMHTVRWDGTDESNEPVASGIYLYRLKTEKTIKAKKMLLLK